MIGLATKAGKVASGEFCTEKEVKSGRACLVIVADDASDNTKKKFQNMCDFYQVPIYFYKDKETLGHAMGKEFRASLVVLDEGFAKGIRKHIDTEKSDNCVEEADHMSNKDIETNINEKYRKIRNTKEKEYRACIPSAEYTERR